jgi:hypothetical protein
MDATAFIQSDLASLAETYEVWERTDDSGAYQGSLEDTGQTVDVRVFSPSSQQQVVTEGSGSETSYTGLKNVVRDSNDNIVHEVSENQQLRLNGKRYDVRVKEAHPSEENPELWRLGLDKANQ